MRKRLLFLAVAALAGIALLTAACGDDDDNGGSGATATSPASGTAAAVEPQDVTVTAHDFGFDKTTITAKAGQVINITLNNTGATEHSFTVGDADVTEAEAGDEKSGTFTASSTTVEFHCKYHPTTMKGTITVSGASSENLSPTKTSSGAGIGGYGY